MADNMQQACDKRKLAAGGRHQTYGNIMLEADIRQQTANGRRQAAGIRQQASDSRHLTAGRMSRHIHEQEH